MLEAMNSADEATVTAQLRRPARGVVGVAYGTDIDEVKQILITALRGIKGVHPNRNADVIFTGFGDSALELEVRCWINAYADKPKLIGRINEAAYKALNAAGIEIPFPQRVVWTARMKEEEKSVARTP